MPNRTAPRSALFVAALFPTVAAVVLFGPLARHPHFATLWLLGKGLQLLLAWPWLVGQEKPAPHSTARDLSVLWRPGRPGTLRRALWSGTVLASGVALGWLLLRSSPLLVAEVSLRVGRRLDSFRATELAGFAALAAAIALVHSAYEELYWRQFLHRQLTRRIGSSAANLSSSTAFAAHHAVVVWAYSGHLVTTVIATLGVAAAGVIWCLHVERDATLRGAWLSHVLADVAVLALAYELHTRA